MREMTPRLVSRDNRERRSQISLALEPIHLQTELKVLAAFNDGFTFRREDETGNRFSRTIRSIIAATIIKRH